jgi:DNA-binding NarL/FixJ family response regulator
MMREKHRIVIIEDDLRLRNSFVETINQSSNYVVAGEYSDVNTALKRINELPNVIIFLDVHLGDVNSIEHIETIKRQNPYNKVVMLSSDSSSYSIVNAFQNGADGYLLKEDAVFSLGSYLNDMMRFQFVVSQGVANSLVTFISNLRIPTNGPRVNNKIELLTPAQKLVYRQLLTEKTYGDIASHLGISRNTVAQHVQKIYRTLEVESRMELMSKNN